MPICLVRAFNTARLYVQDSHALAEKGMAIRSCIEVQYIISRRKTFEADQLSVTHNVMTTFQTKEQRQPLILQAFMVLHFSTTSNLLGTQ